MWIRFTSKAALTPSCGLTGSDFMGRYFHGRPQVIFAGVFAIGIALVTLISSPPWLMRSGHPVAAAVVYAIFEPLCHQQRERSFVIFGWSFAVCARCTGIYSGFLFGLLLYPLLRRIDQESTPHRLWLIASLTMMAVEALGGWAGVFPSSFLTRTATGALAGAVSAFFVLPGLVSVFGSRLGRLAATIPEASPVVRTK